MPRYCPNLTSVELHCRRAPKEGLRITQVSIMALAQHCHQLTRLYLYNCEYLDYPTLFNIFHACPLTDICIAPRFLDPATCRQFTESAATSLHRHHRHLTSLRIAPYVDSDATAFITTVNTHTLIWPYLSTFYLGGCHEVTDTMAINFIRAHPKLQTLQLANGSRLTDHFLDNVAAYLPDLTVLKFLSTPQLTAGDVCCLIKSYNGKLKQGVFCYGCQIFPDDDDFPRTLDNKLYKICAWKNFKPEVEWFSGNAFTDDCNVVSEEDTSEQEIKKQAKLPLPKSGTQFLKKLLKKIKK